MTKSDVSVKGRKLKDEARLASIAGAINRQGPLHVVAILVDKAALKNVPWIVCHVDPAKIEIEVLQAAYNQWAKSAPVIPAMKGRDISSFFEDLVPQGYIVLNGGHCHPIGTLVIK